ncbi:MAG: GNAT family N-acetyltransferase [Clostridia bacterium]|nr:GNAT family N-acetyltransferase [Clostridia bacterium]
MVKIRYYEDRDELEWVRCRVLSFLDCSYYDDVKTKKEEYENPSICLVAVDEKSVVGLIDIEVEIANGEICSNEHKGTGAVIWHLAVMPEYRNQGIASWLWKEALKDLPNYGVSWVEAWTQGDKPANSWYKKNGFKLLNKHTWLRCYADSPADFLDSKKLGKVYGTEQLIFDAPKSRYSELKDKCSRIEKVRLYGINL